MQTNTLNRSEKDHTSRIGSTHETRKSVLGLGTSLIANTRKVLSCIKSVSSLCCHVCFQTKWVLSDLKNRWPDERTFKMPKTMPTQTTTNPQCRDLEDHEVRYTGRLSYERKFDRGVARWFLSTRFKARLPCFLSCINLILGHNLVVYHCELLFFIVFASRLLAALACGLQR